MKKLLFMLAFIVFVNFVNAQCNYFSSVLGPTWVAPAAIGDSVYSSCIYAGEFVRVTGMVAGATYEVSTCGTFTFDSQITIYPGGGGSYLEYNDDGCGNLSIINFTPPNSGNYDILINKYNCQADTLCTQFKVKKIPCPLVTGSMNIYSNPVCPNDEVHFNAYGGTSYQWNFGDGSPFSTESHAVHTYAVVGNYPVWVQITNGCGNDTTLYDTVPVVNNSPIINGYLNIDPSHVCPNNDVNFYAQGGSSYQWDFGDGSPHANTNNEHHIYTTAGDYPVWVILTNGCGNDTTLYDTVHVINNLPVTGAYIVAYPNPVCPNDKVSLYTQSGYLYQWNFGDGSPASNSSSNQHVFFSAGNYPVWVKTINGCGNDTTLYDTIHVLNNLPVTNVNYSIEPNPVCPDNEVSFYAHGGNAYQWNFGDGSPVVNNYYCDHSFDAAGNYPVWVKIINGCGNDTTLYDTIYVINSLIIQNTYIEIHPNPICPNDVINLLAQYSLGGYLYQWDFGDGSPGSTQINPSHSYVSSGNYPVGVNITNGCGNDTNLHATVQVLNNLPVTNGNMNISPDIVCPNNPVSFYAGGYASSYLWNFGDGSPVSHDVYSTTHAYSSTGIYNVSVILSNGCGTDTTIHRMVHVVNSAIPDPDDYDFGSISDELCLEDTALFYVSPAGSGTYLWNFGDGSSDSTTFLFHDGWDTYDMMKHKYSSPGIYAVNFTLANGCGNSFSTQFYVTVGNDISIEGWLWWAEELPAAGASITFYAQGGSSYQWNFGDGTPIVNSTSYITTAYHTYASMGTYTITVIITNSCGNTKTITENITIGPVGISEQIQDNNFALYPNPANDIITIENASFNNNKDAMISVYNLQGNLLLQQPMLQAKTEIDISNFAGGMYFVKLRSKKYLAVKKFIKE